jgi:glutamate-5-semialdehyde dehydrogenase
MSQYMNSIGQNARKATLERVNTSIKNKVLKRYALLLDKERSSIIIANTKDIKFAQ